MDYADDGSFTGLWYATRDENVVPHFRLDSEIPARSRLNLVVTDSERQTSDALEATILPALPPAETAAGAQCDLSRVLHRCAEGSFCALAQGDPSARCYVPPAECDGPWEIRPFTPPMVEGNFGAEAIDRTIGFCSLQRGDLGAEQVYRYVPESTGTHTFRFTGEAATLFIRRHCALRGAPESEFACARAGQGGTNAGQDVVSLDAELEAGVPVYLFMESAWYGGGPYTLSVETP